eukprot:10713147-Heterocapsa_arctica.AAC.1
MLDTHEYDSETNNTHPSPSTLPPLPLASLPLPPMPPPQLAASRYQAEPSPPGASRDPLISAPRISVGQACPAL